jgi:hypothetical protein
MTIDSYSDNKAMITSLLNRQQYHDVYANATLTPDWDILEQIHRSTFALTPTMIRFNWVKGHQDSSKPINELPIEAQYNVQADALANEYIDEHSLPRPISPLLPATSCLFHLNHQTIHGGYTKTIREAASLPELFGYLKTRYKWTTLIRSSIGWTWFQRAVRHLYLLRDQVQHIHRTVYFPSNLKDFITNSSFGHMRHYVLNYTPAIRTSIKVENTRRNRARPITSYSGYTRVPSHVTTTIDSLDRTTAIPTAPIE